MVLTEMGASARTKMQDGRLPGIYRYPKASLGGKEEGDQARANTIASKPCVTSITQNIRLQASTPSSKPNSQRHAKLSKQELNSPYSPHPSSSTPPFPPL
jgi:hypothetical protein